MREPQEASFQIVDRIDVSFNYSGVVYKLGTFLFNRFGVSQLTRTRHCLTSFSVEFIRNSFHEAS